jgi:hypothetical protein
MAYSNLTNPGNYQLAAFGQKGFEHLTGVQSATGGNYNAIQVLAEASLTVTASNGDSLPNVTVPTGMTIVGKFTAVSIASGTVLAYHG